MIAPGLRFGRYEVGDRIGKGGFGVVHFARDVELGRELAIKFLRREYHEKAKVVQRFLQEARAAARIGHPGIVTVFECGEIAGTGPRADGTAFIAMELLKGESLAERIAERGQLPLELAISIARQLAAALGAAHHAGIIHRDLKPDNVHLIADPAVRGGVRIKILDFGVAKLVEAGAGMHTHSQVILGTPRYMPPEQSRSAARADHRADIYALGCILYELVCGYPPYNGDLRDVIAKHQSAPIPSPRSLVPTTPLVLDRLISAMLAKAPADRPSSMADVDAALALCETGEPREIPTDSGEERTLRDPAPPVTADVIPTTPYGRPFEAALAATIVNAVTPTEHAPPPAVERSALPLPPPAPTPFGGTPTIRDLPPMIPPRRPSTAVPATAPAAPAFPNGTAAHEQPAPAPAPRAPSTSEVTAVQPPKRERSRLWQFLVILAGLMVGAFVSLLLLSPRDPAARTPSTNSAIVPMPAPAPIDAPPEPPEPAPPIDAPPIDPAPIDAPLGEERARRESTCREWQAREKWGDLLQCAEQLSALDPELAREFKTRAIEEERSAPRIADCEQALEARDLERAKAALDQVWPNSVSYQRLAAAYVRAARAAKTAPRAQPPPPKCDADALAARADEQWMAGAKEDAFRSIEMAVACRAEPQHVQKALVLACNLGKLAKAKSYWKRMNAAARQRTLTICVRNGLTEEQLNAP